MDIAKKETAKTSAAVAKKAEELSKTAGEKFDTAKKQAAKKAAKTGNKVKKSSKATSKSAKNYAKEVKTSFGEGLGGIKEGAKVAGEAIKETAKGTASATAKFASEVGQNIDKVLPDKKDVKVLNFFIEYCGKQVSKEDIVNRFKTEWQKEHKLTEIKTLNIYYKVEDSTAYFVVNGEIKMSIKML